MLEGRDNAKERREWIWVGADSRRSLEVEEMRAWSKVEEVVEGLIR